MPMDETESPKVTEVSAAEARTAFCARNSAGQLAGSLDEWDGGAGGEYIANGRDRVGNRDRGERGLSKGVLRAKERGSARRLP